jgi:phosphomethylpyrimidine synthase
MSENNLNEKTSNEVRLPASRKIYVETNGSTANQTKHNLRVPFREIALSQSRNFKDELETNQPVRVYDTSGVWTDPAEKCDVREGLPTLRRDWIRARGDVEEYAGRDVTPQQRLFDERRGRNRKIKTSGKLEEFPGLNARR